MLGKALAMIKMAFDALNGIKFALPKVQIAGEARPPPPRPGAVAYRALELRKPAARYGSPDEVDR